MGRLNAPGSVLSIMKMATGSAGRSWNSISALPGPIPRTFPEKESTRRSWPAAYSFMSFANWVAFVKVCHASSCTFSESTPFRWVMMSSMSSPQWVT